MGCGCCPKSIYPGDQIWINSDLSASAITRLHKPYGIVLILPYMEPVGCTHFTVNTSSPNHITYPRVGLDFHACSRWATRMRHAPHSMCLVENFMKWAGFRKLDELTAEDFDGTQELPVPEAHYTY